MGTERQTGHGTGAAAWRSRFFYRLVRPLVMLFSKCLLGFKGERLPDIEGNYLLLANHTTDYDMLMTCGASRRHMYYVGSEHIFQKGWPSRLLMWALSPIIRQKGGVASSTVMAVTRALRRGDNVCIFAEGNRSFDGETCNILPSTGKLAKAGGSALVTYRLENGYLTTPRWAYTIRRGRMRGRVVNVYTPEQLKAMSADEVYQAINADLWEDAYARQEVERRPFRGQRLAEGLEHVLYICPECGQVGSMTSKGDTLKCRCGMRVKHDIYGFLQGGRFATVSEWNGWQRRTLGEYLSRPGLRISDREVSLYTVNPEHKKELVWQGEAELADGTLRFGERLFPLEAIQGMGIYSRATAVLLNEGEHYEFKGKRGGRFCALKYLHAYEHVTGRRII